MYPCYVHCVIVTEQADTADQQRHVFFFYLVCNTVDTLGAIDRGETMVRKRQTALTCNKLSGRAVIPVGLNVRLH